MLTSQSFVRPRRTRMAKKLFQTVPDPQRGVSERRLRRRCGSSQSWWEADR
jgi:hypothetical protein